MEIFFLIPVVFAVITITAMVLFEKRGVQPFSKWELIFFWTDYIFQCVVLVGIGVLFSGHFDLYDVSRNLFLGFIAPMLALHLIASSYLSMKKYRKVMFIALAFLSYLTSFVLKLITPFILIGYSIFYSM